MINARVAAARALLDVEARRVTLGAALERARRGFTDGRDRALVTELATGVCRWRNELDAWIEHASHRAPAEIDADARAMLRIGAYQLAHLDRVPDHAVVNESVEGVRTLGAPRAAGFVNAVLRRLAQSRITSALPKPPGASATPAAHVRYLSIAQSHPAWLVERWIVRHGLDAAAAWCAFNNASPAMTLRPLDDVAAVLAALGAAGIPASAAPWVYGAIQVPAGEIGRVPPELAARVAVQDEASQIVAHVVGATPGDRVLDLCAAPGGKTVILDRAAGPDGLVVAGDVRSKRVNLLRTTLAHAHARARVLTLDATRALPFAAVFDRVLLDAPCSGLGTLRRDPDLKWTRTADDLAPLADVQRRMIARAADAVKPGGRLVYSTCSSEPEENDAIVAGLLDARRDFHLEPAVAGDRVPNGARLLDELGYLRTLPFRDGLDAYFAAVLVRR
jgi:16S rRNA (cytosine967-C5)-methyltransferase